MTLKQSGNTESIDEQLKEAKELSIECPHGNWIGWCDDCKPSWTEYIKKVLKAKDAEREAAEADIIKKLFAARYGFPQKITEEDIQYAIKNNDFAKILQALNPTQ